MMRGPVLLTAIVLASLAFAGCAGDDGEGGATTPTETLDATKGTISGTVVDASITPIEGARVTLRETGTQVFTDAQGAFEATNVEPGRHTVYAEALGFRSMARSAEVVAGGTAKASFQLEPVPIEEIGEPRIDVHVFEGFLACGLGTVLLVASACSEECTDDPLPEQCTKPDPNDAFHYPFNVTTGIRGMVVEMTWVPTGGFTSQEMQFAVERDGCGLDCNETWIERSGTPPLRGEIPEDSRRFNLTEDPKALQVRVFPSFTAVPNVYYQQRFTVYISGFYNYPAQEGYSAVPDQ